MLWFRILSGCWLVYILFLIKGKIGFDSDRVGGKLVDHQDVQVDVNPRTIWERSWSSVVGQVGARGTAEGPRRQLYVQEGIELLVGDAVQSYASLRSLCIRKMAKDLSRLICFSRLTLGLQLFSDLY